MFKEVLRCPRQRPPIKSYSPRVSSLRNSNTTRSTKSHFIENKISRRMFVTIFNTFFCKIESCLGRHKPFIKEARIAFGGRGWRPPLNLAPKCFVGGWRGRHRFGNIFSSGVAQSGKRSAPSSCWTARRKKAPFDVGSRSVALNCIVL